MPKKNIDSIFPKTEKKEIKDFHKRAKIKALKKKTSIKFIVFKHPIPTKPYLQKISSLFLITTILFQSVAGLFLLSPAPQAKAAVSWYNTGYSYRKQITIDRTKIPHADTTNTNPYLTDFPILISLTDNNLKSVSNGGKVQKADGSDIIFSNQTGTNLLNYEIESYEPSTGTLVAWVKIPQLNDISNTQDTVIYVYYGNSSAPVNTTSNMQGVWDSNFKMVQHMNQTGTGQTGDYKDSTANSNNSINTAGQPTVAAGKIGRAESFDGTSQYVNVGNNTSLDVSDSLTLSGWIKVNGLIGTYQFIFDYKNSDIAYLVGKESSGTLTPRAWIKDNSGTGAFISSPEHNMNDGKWHYLNLTYSSAIGRIWLDGAIVEESNIWSGSLPLSTRNVVYGGSSFNGLIDEARVSSVARSSDWISTEYKNQSNPSSFYSIGSEEDSITPPSLSEVTPVQVQTNDTTPSYTFSSTKSGDITYSGDCSSSTVFANFGNNTITFNTLSYGTHNNCTITVTDAAGNTSSALNVSSFTIDPNYAWYNNSYSYRKEIVIDRTKIPHTDTTNTNPYLTDFPILISLTDNNLKSVSNGGKVQKEDGSDIIFSNQLGTALLNYEIESYEASTGTLVAWVKIPQLNDTNNTQNTVIYMYYGNSAASANTASNMQGVWDSNFKMVQHMNQTGTGTAGDYKDSTANSNNSINIANQPVVAAGKIGKAENFNGTSQYIDVGNKSGLNIPGDLTLDTWVNYNTNTESQYPINNLQYQLFMRGNSTGNNNRTFFCVRIQEANSLGDSSWSSRACVVTNSQYLTNTWYHVVGIKSGNDLKIYVNGVLSRQLPNILSGYTPSTIAGSLITGANPFSGLIDEVRVSSVARSSDWISAEYANQSNPSSFTSFSPDQSVSILSLDHFAISGANTQASGSTQSLTLTAIDYAGNTFTAYNGDKQITFSGANITGSNTPAATDKDGNPIPFNTPATITFTNGVAHTNITLYKAETAGIGIKDNDSYSSSGYNLSVTVSPHDNIQSIGINAPLFAVSGNSFSLTLSTEDSYGNTINNPTSPITLSTDKGTISPSSINPSSFTYGSYTGDFTITNITENTDTTITARYNNITSNITIPVRGIAQMDHFSITKASIQTKSANIIIGKTPEPNTSNFFYSGNYPDDSACIQAALDFAKSGDTILIRQGDYQIDRQVSQTGKDLNIIGEGEVRMHVNFAGLGFYLSGTYIRETPVSIDASKGSDAITIQDASNVLPGDLVTVYNSNLWCPDYYDNQKTGEMYEIKNVSGNNIVLEEGLLRDYPVSLSSKARIYHPVKINIKNLSVLGMDAEGDGWGIELQYCKDSSITDSYFNNNGDRALAVFNCSNVDVGNNIILNSNKAGNGYGISVANASMNIRIHDNLMRNCRHTIMSGSGGYLDLNRNVYIQNNTLYEDTGKSNVIDAHPTTINYFINDNTIYANNNHSFNDGTAYSIFSNNLIYGGLGVEKRGTVRDTVHIITKNTVLYAPLVYDSFIYTKELYFYDNYALGDIDNYLFYSYNTGARDIILQNNKAVNTLYPIYITVPASSISNINISNNQITYAQRAGMYINYTSDSSGTLNIYRNTIHNPSSAGTGSNAIELYGIKNSLIARNDITDDYHRTPYGIYEDSNSQGNHIFQNTSLGLLGQTLLSQSTSTNLTEGTIPTDTPTLYPLSVINGTGTGNYEVGTEVNISANIPSNKIFDQWTGDTGYISDKYSPQTIATLPQESITLIPTYKDIDQADKGEAVTINIRAISSGKDSYVEYSGDKQVVFSGANKEGAGKTATPPTATDKDGKDIPFGQPTTITFRSGLATSNIKLYKGETAYINITDGTCNSFSDKTHSFPLTVQTENSSTPSLPQKPSQEDITASLKNINLNNLPKAIKQIAVSTTDNFLHSSWQNIENIENILKQYADKANVYLKFRTQDGAVSDTITYTPQTPGNSQNGNTDIKDGDTVKIPNSPDIYVIKTVNNKKYKRLILSPSVFTSYQHLKWENIKTITEEELNQYQTSSLVKELTDTIIYSLIPDGDTGKRKPFDITQTYDPDSIYTINKVDRDSYEWEE